MRHAYRLMLEQDAAAIDYATIVELHHPDYLLPTDLARLFGDTAMPRLSAAELRDLRSLVLDLDYD
jgi:hypothetical protein